MSWTWKKGLPVRSYSRGGRQPLPKTGQEIEEKKKYDPCLFLSTASCQPEVKWQGGPGNIPTVMDFGERSRAENILRKVCECVARVQEMASQHTL